METFGGKKGHREQNGALSRIASTTGRELRKWKTKVLKERRHYKHKVKEKHQNREAGSNYT